METSASLPRRVRNWGRRVYARFVAELDSGRLQALPGLLGVGEGTILVTRQSLKINSRLEWREETQQKTNRAGPSLYNAPWWAHVWYSDRAGQQGPHLGLARLVLCPVDGVRHTAVVFQRMELATPRAGCILSSFNCSRYK